MPEVNIIYADARAVGNVAAGITFDKIDVMMSPYQKLYAAVISQAVRDLRCKSKSLDAHLNKITAIRFFSSRLFDDYASHAGICPDRVRIKIGFAGRA